jgi:hypothetical protein
MKQNENRLLVFCLALVLIMVGMQLEAMYPQIYKSKGHNFNQPGIDAFEITLDTNNVLYVWREIDGVAVEVANIENWCEPVESQ